MNWAFAQPIGEKRFFDWVDLGDLSATDSLEKLSGVAGGRSRFASSLVQRADESWASQFALLTCEQVRLLVGQRMGLEWLARPVMAFVQCYPDAYIANYPGELSCLVLRAREEFFKLTPQEFRHWVEGGFAWMDAALGFDRDLRRDVREDLERARSLLRH